MLTTDTHHQALSAVPGFETIRKLNLPGRSAARQKKPGFTSMRNNEHMNAITDVSTNPLKPSLEAQSPPKGGPMAEATDGNPSVAKPQVISPASITVISEQETNAIRELGLVALCFCGPNDVVPRTLNDPVGVRPILPCISTSWNDTTLAKMDRYSPIFYQGVLFRLWFTNKRDANRLVRELPALLSAKGGALRAGWFDIGVTVDLVVLQLEIMEFAERLRLKVFSDPDVLQFVGQHITKGKPN